MVNHFAPDSRFALPLQTLTRLFAFGNRFPMVDRLSGQAYYHRVFGVYHKRRMQEIALAVAIAHRLKPLYLATQGETYRSGVAQQQIMPRLASNGAPIMRRCQRCKGNVLLVEKSICAVALAPRLRLPGRAAVGIRGKNAAACTARRVRRRSPKSHSPNCCSAQRFTSNSKVFIEDLHAVCPAPPFGPIRSKNRADCVLLLLFTSYTTHRLSQHGNFQYNLMLDLMLQ